MNKVQLIPWDPTSEQHYRRLYDQRVACGWHEEQLETWKEAQLGGIKVIYWIVLLSDLPGRDELLSQHLAQFPKEGEPLIDSAATIFKTPREPAGLEFIPVGHIALECVSPDGAKELSLPLSTVWLQNFYVSWALHRGGIGRSAMAAVEREAAAQPLHATVVALNTLQREVQESEEFMRRAYDDRGMVRPQNFKPNQVWYRGQGYELMPGPESAEYVDPTTRKLEIVMIVWLKKSLA